MSDDDEITEEEQIRFNAHALLKSLFQRTLAIQTSENWSDLESSDIGHQVKVMSMDIEDYFASMGIKSEFYM